MIAKSIAFLIAALVLANCCVSGIGCGVPTAGPGTPTAGPIAWDGLGAAPTEDTQPVEPRSNKPRSKKEITVSPLGAAEGQQNARSQPRDSWEQQQAADQDDEMRLKRKLMICSDCVAPEPNRDNATARATR